MSGSEPGLSEHSRAALDALDAATEAVRIMIENDPTPAELGKIKAKVDGILPANEPSDGTATGGDDR
jgi:hypothetical protein